MNSQIVTPTTRYLDEKLLQLGPRMSLTPFLVTNGPHGIRRMELHPDSDPDFPDTVRVVVPTFIVVSEAIEVTVTRFFAHSDVDERAVIAHWHPGGETYRSAQVIRRNGHPPVIGGWEDGAARSVEDIAAGVRSGLDLVQRLWLTEGDDLRHRIDAIRAGASSDDTTVIPLTVDALTADGWLG